MLPRPRPPQPSILHQFGRQLLAFRHPMFWGTASVLLLSGLFLLEYWQPRSLLRGFSGKPALNGKEANSTPYQNPSLYRSPSGNSARFNGGELPPLPPVLPAEPNAQIPAAPNLPGVPGRAPEATTQQTRSRGTADRALPFSPGIGGNSASDRSTDLYNPTGIPIPERWQQRSSRTQAIAEPLAVESPATGASNPAANPEGNPEGNAVSPLQSALDRVRTSGNVDASGNPPGLTRSPAVSQTSDLPQLPDQTGAVQSLPTQPISPSPQLTPRVTGYTVPPAFRTPDNTSPFYRSSDGSPDSSPGRFPISNPAQPEMLEPLPMSPTPSGISPSRVPQSSSGRSLGGREINTFSNP